MNKILTNILLAFLFCQAPFLFAIDDCQNVQHVTVKCAPQLQKFLNKILQVTEARALIAAIQKEGPIQIMVRNNSLSNHFGAFWDQDQRIICISLSRQATEGEIIGSILFELHNASVSKKFDQLDELAVHGKINKAKYVQSMEYLEYVNSHNAAKIAQKGIEMGVFPWDARLPTYSSFKEHFTVQQRSGHSACFARMYEGLCRTNSLSG